MLLSETAGPFFKCVRKMKRLTQRSLGEKLGVTHVHLSYIENNKSKPSLELLDRLIEISGKRIFLDFLQETL